MVDIDFNVTGKYLNNIQDPKKFPTKNVLRIPTFCIFRFPFLKIGKEILLIGKLSCVN